MVVVAGRVGELDRRRPVEIDERRDDPAAHEGGERPLAGDGGARSGYEQADGTAIGVRGRRERRHDDDGDGAVGGGRAAGAAMPARSHRGSHESDASAPTIASRRQRRGAPHEARGWSWGTRGSYWRRSPAHRVTVAR